MRRLPFITVGKILEELSKEGLTLSRLSVYRREKDIKGFPLGRHYQRGNMWRRYSRKQADLVKVLLRKYYFKNILKPKLPELAPDLTS